MRLSNGGRVGAFRGEEQKCFCSSPHSSLWYPVRRQQSIISLKPLPL